MTTDQAIQALVAKGAALVFAADPNQNPIPVAWWRRVNSGRHFWHGAGLSEFDHHGLDFAREEIHYDGLAVSFYDKAGKRVAYLTEIPEVQTDTMAAARMAEQIAFWRREYDSNAYLRANILAAYNRAGA